MGVSERPAQGLVGASAREPCEVAHGAQCVLQAGCPAGAVLRPSDAEKEDKCRAQGQSQGATADAKPRLNPAPAACHLDAGWLGLWPAPPSPSLTLRTISTPGHSLGGAESPGAPAVGSQRVGALPQLQDMWPPECFRLVGWFRPSCP